MTLSSSSDSPLTAYSRHWDRTITVCQHGQHRWAGGDNDVVYCSECMGYACPICGSSGRVENGLSMKRCYACSGLGVQMWWEPEGRLVNPYNWALAALKEPDRA